MLQRVAFCNGQFCQLFLKFCDLWKREQNPTLDGDSNALATGFLSFALTTREVQIFSIFGYIEMLTNPTDVKFFDE